MAQQTHSSRTLQQADAGSAPGLMAGAVPMWAVQQMRLVHDAERAAEPLTRSAAAHHLVVVPRHGTLRREGQQPT